MESDESGSRNVLLGTIDEHLVRMRDHIKVVLGKQRSKVYFSYFKEWLRGHKSQEEFNGLGLAMMPTDQKFVHSDFFVTMKKLCDMQHKEDNAVLIFDDNRLTKQQKDLNASAQGVSNDQAIKKPRLISDIEYVDTRQSTAIVPSIPTEYNAMMEGLSEVHPFSGWLPSKGQIKGRMLLAVWEHGIESITDDCINPLLVVIRTMVTNIIEEAIKIKRTHLVTGSGYSHTYGVRKRNNVNRLSEGYIVVPSKSPISTADCIDALKIDRDIVKNSRLYDMIIRRLYIAK